MHYRLKITLTLLAIIIFGCGETRDFEWPVDIKALTGGDLETWILKSPFDGYWNPNYGNEDKMVITNTDQVFPFLGKYNNADDDFKNYSQTDGDIFQEATAIFKDPKWGESFVHAVILYEPEELFLQSSYSERGNIAFSGVNSINESYYASLSETKVYEKNENYKTVIYWVYSNNTKYLFGFYQSQQLVLEFAFPCNDEPAGIEKIRSINEALGINIKEWSNLKEADLNVNNNPLSFWKDPYTSLYLLNLLPDLNVKLNTTNFERYNHIAATERGVDYLFAYENEKGRYELTFSTEQTNLTQAEYEEQQSEKDFLEIVGDTRRLFINEDSVVDNIHQLATEVYFRDNKILKIDASYPEDPKFKGEITDILTRIRIRQF